MLNFQVLKMAIFAVETLFMDYNNIFKVNGRDTGEEIVAQRDRPSTVDMQQVIFSIISRIIISRKVPFKDPFQPKILKF